jgi:ABC-type lipoprotein export system ATPase subunit
MSAARAPEPVLRVEKVGYEVGARRTLLDDVSFTVAAGEALALVGRSGSGKTTMCHLAAGVGAPTRGQILLDGVPVRTARDWSSIALLPQRLGLVDELTVEQNVLLPTVGGDAPPAVHDHAQALFSALDIDSLRGRTAGRTSLGEQQRTALARALVLKPRLAVLDEPTGHQDDDHVSLVVAALDVARRAGVALLVATHDDRLVGAADRVVQLSGGRVVTASRAEAT